LSGSADNSIKLWQVEGGKELQHWGTKAPVRSVDFGTGDRLFLATTDQVLGLKPVISVFDLGQSKSPFY
jgi:translation initiation factor 3 subunit I